VIVTDKTGTITENKMKIAAFYPADKGKEILEIALGPITEYSLSPLEQEIKNKAGELKIDTMLPKVVRQRNLGNGRKTKAIIRENGQGYELFSSGAPEEIFGNCINISDDIKAALSNEAEKGRRVIAIAF